MTVYVVDSSVAVKWYVPETGSQLAAALLDEGYELHAPDLLSAEFGNVLWKKFRRGDLTGPEVRSIARALPTVPLHIHPSLTLLEGALEIALETRRTVYDSLYLALSVALSCTLVTADARLSNALRDSPLARHVSRLSHL